MANTKWIYLLIFSLATYLMSCKPKSNQSFSKEKGNSKLFQYYKKNNWQYPIEIDASKIKYDKNIEIDNTLSPSVLKQKIFNWCVFDSILAKHFNDEAIRIYDIGLTTIKDPKYMLTCRIDFYREGDIIDGAVSPVEGHGIVENKFLRQKEIAIFFLNNDTLTFSNWKQ